MQKKDNTNCKIRLAKDILVSVKIVWLASRLHFVGKGSLVVCVEEVIERFNVFVGDSVRLLGFHHVDNLQHPVQLGEAEALQGGIEAVVYRA